MKEYTDKSAYKEHLTRRNYLTLLATKLATKYKPSAKIGEIREIVRKYDAKRLGAATTLFTVLVLFTN